MRMRLRQEEWASIRWFGFNVGLVCVGLFLGVVVGSILWPKTPKTVYAAEPSHWRMLTFDNSGGEDAVDHVVKSFTDGQGHIMVCDELESTRNSTGMAVSCVAFNK